MKLILKNSSIIFIFCIILSCNKKNNDIEENTNSGYSNTTENTDYENNSNSENSEEEENDTFSSSTSSCDFDDGSYSASVDYNNPETGYSATYTLDVDVEDCQVVQINFPNDGYLDEDHITAADLDEDGNASVDGEDGKTYEIKIDH